MTVKFDYTGKVAFVTGAGTGIGRATALAFAQAGASVAAVGIDGADVQETARLITSAGGNAVAIACDVSDEDAVKAAVEQTVDELGHLDFAFNNAGVEHEVIPLADISAEQWERIMTTNLYGTFFCIKHQAPVMVRQGGGAIVTVSSGAGVKGIAGQSAYCASKWGIIGLTKAAALDYAEHNIRANVIAPGYIDTPMLNRITNGTEEGRQKVNKEEPVGRPGKPEEIAGTVLWLCSDLAAFTTGAVLVVDGGQTV